ncbi:MAG: rod shape-determining protein MreD [Syntrophomonadaceae bacterium]|nr:rod shape-determining protein MreD [Syntrophomonadaceae bacterium]
MRYLLLVLIPFGSILLDSVFFSRFTLWGAIPDLILIFITFYALFHGSRPGFMYGFLCGLFEDLYLGRFIGANALSKALVAFIIGKLEVNVFKDNLMVGFIGVILATVINFIIMTVLFLVTTPDMVFNQAILINLGGQLIYNGLLSLPLYIWYYRVARKYIVK